MVGDQDWIVGVERFDDAIVRFVVGLLRNEGAKQLVPDDEHAGIVGIQVARVGRMMDAVMARRIEHGFEPLGAFVDRLGMDPELIDQVDAARDADKGRVEPEQNQAPTNHDEPGEGSEPGLPERC